MIGKNFSVSEPNQPAIESGPGCLPRGKDEISRYDHSAKFRCKLTTIKALFFLLVLLLVLFFTEIINPSICKGFKAKFDSGSRTKK
jgi:hypothetical protein